MHVHTKCLPPMQIGLKRQLLVPIQAETVGARKHRHDFSEELLSKVPVNRTSYPDFLFPYSIVTYQKNVWERIYERLYGAEVNSLNLK